MAQHVKILGVLHILLGGLGVLAANHSSDGLTAIPLLGVIGGFVFILVMTLSLPGLIIGIGLMQFRPWARMGGIILSAFDLLGFPFHTALGIYGLWVLLSRETEQMFGVPRARAF
jgi:hypothetical protein